MRAFVMIFKFFRRLLWSVIANYSHSGPNMVRANGFTWFSRNTVVGLNANFNGMRVYGRGKVEIGDNFHSGKGVSIYTQSHNYRGGMIPYDRSLVFYEIRIGDNVWLGDNVTIVGNVVIGEGAIVQVGSVVSSSVLPLEIVGGNPARAFKKRDAIHYFSKKESGKFH